MICSGGWVEIEYLDSSIQALNSDPTTRLFGKWRAGNVQSGKVQLLCDSETNLDRKVLNRVKQLTSIGRVNQSPIPKEDSVGLGDLVSKALSTVGLSEERVSRWVGAPCGCPERKEKLNRLGFWATRVLKGQLDKAREFLESLIDHDEPEQVATMPEQPQISTKSTMYWAYGITTVPSRRNELFPRTLESLKKAGFDSPRLFIDQCSTAKAVELYSGLGFPLSVRDGVRTAGHWVLSMYELYIRHPTAERFAIFQDDFVTVRNLCRYLELVPYPKKGYLNLYTFPSNQELAKGRKGWYEANQLGRGAVALVFSREAVIKLLGHPYLAERFQDQKRGHKAIDGGIVETMKRAEFKEYVHNPSLTQHTGLESSMGNPRHQLAPSFPGENFDALELLK